MQQRVREIQRQETEIAEGGGTRSVERQHAKGRLTARERIARLIDPESEFFELESWAGWRMYDSWGGAPAAGVVVSVVDDLADQPLGSKDPKNPAGNHVVIQIGEALFLFLAHLKQDTVTVKPGEGVRRAQTVGLCGNSGNTDFPHIHLHIQDSPIFNSGTGQNPIFGPIDVELTGKQFEAVTWPLISGLFVSHTEEPVGR